MIQRIQIAILLTLLAGICIPARSQTAAINGYCTLGSTPATVSGLNSSNLNQGLIPQCQVSVYLTGTITLATIYADAVSTPLTNPFTASTKAQWLFFAAVGQGYDVVMSGGYPPLTYTSPVTLTDLMSGGGGGGGGCTTGGSAGTLLATNGTGGCQNINASLVGNVFTLTATSINLNATSILANSSAICTASNGICPIGTLVSVNGGSTLITANFNGTTPAAPSGQVNAAVQIAGSNVSFNVPENPPVTSSLQLAYTQQGTGQYVLVPFTNAACSAQGSGTSYDTGGSLTPLTYGGGGFFISGGQDGQCVFSIPALPSGVTVGQITGLYAVGFKSQTDYGNATPTETTHLVFTGTGLTGCSPERNSSIGGMTPTPLQYGCQLTGSFANFSTIIATSTGATNPFEGGGALDYIAALEVDYTGTPVVQTGQINLGPGFGWNQTTDTLSLLPFALYPLTISSLEGLPEQPANVYNLVVDATNTTGPCSGSGGGTNAVWCVSNGVNGYTAIPFSGVSTVNTNTGALVFNFSSGAGSCSYSAGTTTCTITGSSSGGGSVTNVIAGTLPSFLGLTIATSTSTPTLNFTASAIPNSALATQTANTVLGALTATTPSGLSLPSCSSSNNALTWASGTGFGCNSISGIGYPSGTGIAAVVGGAAWATTPYNASNLIPANFISILNQNTTGNAATATALVASPTQCSTGNAPTGITSSGNANGCAALGGSPLWSSLLAPTGNLSISMVGFTTTLSYGNATGAADLFKKTDSSGNSGTGILDHDTTASGSSETPWQADANGIGCKISTSGQLVCFGGMHILTLGANSGGLPSPVASSGSLSTDASGNIYISNAGNSFTFLSIPDVTITTGTGAVSATCLSNTLSSAVTMTGLTTSNTLTFTASTDVSNITGWDTGALFFVPVLGSGSFQWRLCTGNSSGTTPGSSVTWNVSAR